MNSLLIFAALVAVALAMIAWAGDGRERLWEALFGPPDTAPVDLSDLEMPSASGFFLAAPEEQGAQSRAQMRAPVFAVDTARLRQEVLRIVQSEPQTERVAMDQDWLGDRFVQRSKWLRMPAVIQVRYIPIDREHATLAICSRCLVPEHGQRESEVRVKRWIANLEKRCPTSRKSGASPST